MTGFFVTGTDTGVGKTVVASILTLGLDAVYWKPIQTGSKDGRDTDFASRWSSKIWPEAYCFTEPLSPHAAAEIDHDEVSFERTVARAPRVESPVVVEGAGGVMVPLNSRYYMLDLMQALRLPVVVVSRSTLGTINHTLLTLNALRSRGIAVAGVVMVGERNVGNRLAIENYGNAAVIGEVPLTERFSREWMFSQFQKFNLPEFKKGTVTDETTRA